MPGRKWLLNNFMLEVCVDAPPGMSIEEAMEDACDFMETVRHTQARANSGAFLSITNVSELGPKQPADRKKTKIKSRLDRHVKIDKPDKAKVTKTKKAKKKVGRI